MVFIITEPVYICLGPAEGRLRVREFLVALKTCWWPAAVVCSMVRMLSLWHIPHFHSLFYLFATKSPFSVKCNETIKKIIMLCTKFLLAICTQWPISIIHNLCCFDTIAVWIFFNSYGFVREFLATLKTCWWPSTLVFSMVGLLYLWYIPHFHSQF